MLKRIMIGLMSFCMALGIFLVTAQAEELQDGDFLYRILEDNTAEITDYVGKADSVTIPNEIGDYIVTGIGDSAFCECNSLNNIEIPNGVISIGIAAFMGCSSLSSIDIPDGVTKIEYSTFEGCSSLSEVNIPDSVTSIGAYAFMRCSGLSSIDIPDGVTKIEYSTFQRCSSLSEVNIPDSVTSIEAGSFWNCSNLSNVNIPDSVTSIEAYAFMECSSLSSIDIPDGVTKIEYSTFEGCSSLSEVNIPDSVTSIGQYAFWKCSSLSDVYYEGSEESWENIWIGNSNDPLLEAKIHHNTSSFNRIKDINKDDWFYKAVSYAYEKGIMTGINDAFFAPFDTLTRAQFSVILHRMEGKNYVASDKKFDDVEDDSWYTDAVLWAYENGIVSGYENTNKFGPHDNISREQLAVMMYRYAKSSGFDMETDADLSAFKDAGNVSSYAVEAMKWAVGNGIITGKANGTELDPNGNALRAECAVIIRNFMENIISL